MDNTQDKLLGTDEAAAFLRLSEAGVRYHLYQVGDLKPDHREGNKILFTEKTLVDFNARKKRPGRPSVDGD